ncbi:hypothetical protein [Georgenia sunbinii]|uniref:hypothetical protein n=1 Tax=Georgenia sunbinii TaxID=3117728 RepID=UPI002F25FBA9
MTAPRPAGADAAGSAPAATIGASPATTPLGALPGGLLPVPGGLTQLGDADAGICIDGVCAVPGTE